MEEELRKRIGHLEVKVATLEVDNSNLKNKHIELQQKFIDYVTKHEFNPVKAIVYTMAGSVMLAVLTAIMKLVILG